jgi:hypothetical protein
MENLSRNVKVIYNMYDWPEFIHYCEDHEEKWDRIICHFLCGLSSTYIPCGSTSTPSIFIGPSQTGTSELARKKPTSQPSREQPANESLRNT